MERTRLVIYWSRRDFRFADNRALVAALAESKEEDAVLLPLFILENYMAAGNPAAQFGLPSRLFLSRALPHFAAQFPSFIIARGTAVKTILALAHEFAITIHTNEDIHPDFTKQITKIRNAGISIKVYADRLTAPKDTRTGAGSVYSVFTPFKNAVRERFVQTPVTETVTAKTISPVPSHILERIPSLIPVLANDESALLSEFSTDRTFLIRNEVIDLEKLLPRTDPRAILKDWYITEEEAMEHFTQYLTSGSMDAYGEKRDSLAFDAEGTGTSRMSLALAWGLVSARMLVSSIQTHYGDTFVHPQAGARYEGAEKYISELIWREFYAYLLHHRPSLLDTEFQEKFQGTIAWADQSDALTRFTAWIQGCTGYPIVDAAMNQLAQTGWMHNRTRMVVASVLTKNLGVDWRWGQEYFRAALLDLDESSNNGGWQWGASVGADPKPIRIFNPELQAKNYDAEGAYQKKWLPSEYQTHPPEQIIPHKDARAQALARYGLSGVEPRDY